MNQEIMYRRIREAGLRMTSTRKVFLEILFRGQKPLSAKEILNELWRAKREVNKTTVYREIESFEKIGIVRRIQLGERSTYYELALLDHHHHLVCLECDQIEDIDIDEHGLLKQEQKIITERHFRVIRHALEFFGLCRRCQAGTC